MAAVDPVTLEVIRNRLDAIAEEMQETMLKCAFSIILKEGADASSAIFTPQGHVIAQSTSQPLHLGALMPAVNRILEKFPADQMLEGDVFCLNDPYDGGTHLPDLILVVPGVYKGRVVVLGAALAHQQDFGGMAPGSMTIEATEHFQEGLIIGPLKLFSAGKPNETLFSVIERNVRVPDQVVGDIYAEVAAGTTVARRTVELIEEFGLDTFTAAIDALLDHAETLTRAQIAQIPDGEYVFEDCIDNTGGLPLRIRVKVTVAGSDIALDFNGTSEQTRGPVNCSPTGVLAPAFWVLRAMTDPTISNNAGCYRPLTVQVPDRSLLNPRRPSPVSIRAHTLRRVVDVLLGAFAQAVPERVPAASHGSMTCVSYGGVDPVTHAPWVYMECTVGGSGGTARGDGVDVLDTDIENAGNIPAEALELSHPFRLWATRLRPDSGGPGRHRGGLGVERLLEFVGDEAVVSHRSDRHTSQPWGLAGGLPGATYKTLIERADGREEVIAPRSSAVLRRGDRIRILTAGGGGYGDPLARTSNDVSVDVRNRKVSVEAARRDYGVVVIADGTVDESATAVEREARRRVSHDRHLFDRGLLLGAASRHALLLETEGVAVTGPEMTLFADFCVITVNARDEILEHGWVRVQNGRITAVADHPIAPEQDEEVVHGQDRVLLPGLVNTHTHLFQTLIRGVFEELPLDAYLSRVYGCGVELGPADTYLSGVLGGLEAIRSGVTTVVDHHFINRGATLAAATVDGMRAAGVRAVLARTIMDIGDGVPPEKLREQPRNGLRFVDELLDGFRSAIGEGLVAIWTGPNTPGANASDRAVIESHEYARDRGIRRSAHIAEYRGVLDSVARRYGIVGVVRWLDSLGALGADLLAVHAVHVTPAETRPLAETGVAVSHNPFSNLFCGDKNAPVSDYRAAGITVGLGTDGAANNNAQGILDALRMTRLLQRLHAAQPTAIGPREALRMASIDGAKALGLGDTIGSIEPNKRADLIVVDLIEAPHTVPTHDVLLQVVHSVKGTDVTAAMVDGRWVMKDHEILSVDEVAILRKCQHAGRELVRRLS